MIGICGASGYIGRALYDYLKKRGMKVLGTYYRNRDPRFRKFDLRDDPFDLFDRCSYVVITSAYAKIRFCQDHPIESFWLNVYKTRELLQHLSDKGIPALFISSDAAINHLSNTNYGKYKRQIERYIRDNGLKAQFIRPGRINEDNIETLCREIYAYIKLGSRKKVN